MVNHASALIWNSLPADLTDNFNSMLLFGFKAASKCISPNFHSGPKSRKPLMENCVAQLVQSVTCYRGSHSVTCYPTQVNTPSLILDLPTI